MQRAQRRARCRTVTLAALVAGMAMACFEPPRTELMNVESPATGPAGVSGSGGTGSSGSFGSGGTFGGTTLEGATETPGGPAGRTLPREPVPREAPGGPLIPGEPKWPGGPIQQRPFIPGGPLPPADAGIRDMGTQSPDGGRR